MPIPEEEAQKRQAQFQQALAQAVQQAGHTGPVFALTFLAPESVRFAAVWLGNPTEGQFLIAGSELTSIGQRMREQRLEKIGPTRYCSTPGVWLN